MQYWFCALRIYVHPYLKCKYKASILIATKTASSSEGSYNYNARQQNIGEQHQQDALYHFHFKLNTFHAKLDIFQIKLYPLINKLDASEIKMNFFQIQASLSQLKLQTLQDG